MKDTTITSLAFQSVSVVQVALNRPNVKGQMLEVSVRIGSSGGPELKLKTFTATMRFSPYR